MRAIPAGCAHKLGYPSRKRALLVGARRTRQTPRLYAYHCNDCHCWHLSSWSPADKAAFEAQKAKP